MRAVIEIMREIVCAEAALDEVKILTPDDVTGIAVVEERLRELKLELTEAAKQKPVNA